MTSDGAEYRAIADSGSGQPVPECEDRAMPASGVWNGYLSAFARLIGLGTADMDD